MQDGLNLGWKLAQVIQGIADPALLTTYNSERRTCAKELIDFDHRLAQVFSAKNDIDAQVFESFFRQADRYMAGVAIRYAPSLITTAETVCSPELAQGFPIGQRFHSEEVLRCADARKIHLGHTMPADGRWRILIFGGEIGSEAASKAFRLCNWLKSSPASPVVYFTPQSHDIDSIIEVKAVFSGSHLDVHLDKIPSILWPQKGRHGLRDYEKVFVDRWTSAKQPMPSIYHTRKVSRKNGCVVLVRPDQHVSGIFASDKHESIASFFAGFMRQRRQPAV